MSLRIGWASPWNTHSAIALSGTLIVGELVGRGHAVDIIRIEAGEYLELPSHPAPGTIRRLCDVDPRALHREYDVIVVNLGDHYGHHGAAVPVLPDLGAVVVLHDRYYANLAAGAFATPESWLRLRQSVRLTYGDEVIPDDGPYWLPEEQMATTRSMLEWFVGLGIGAIVHARYYVDAAQSACPGPVAVIPLAYPDQGFVPLRPAKDELRVVTLGHVNPNKCADRVLMAIASSQELRRRCRYRLVGPCEDHERAKLLALAHHMGVAPPTFTGRVSDGELLRELEAADVICCLRNPVLEGGSASAIFGMLSGRPLLVSDHGVYREIPDDFVFKCWPGEETADTTRHLLAIMSDPAAARTRGALARDYASRRHSPRAYVDALLPFLERAIAAGPIVMASIQIGRLLGSFGVKPDDPAAGCAVAPLVSLLG